MVLITEIRRILISEIVLIFKCLRLECCCISVYVCVQGGAAKFLA